MAKVHIPDDAVPVLENLLEQIKAATVCFGEDGKGWRSADIDPNDVSQKYFEFADALRVLPHRWCTVDPLSYDVYLHYSQNGASLVFAFREQAPIKVHPAANIPIVEHWPDDVPIPKALKQFAVPVEFANVLICHLQLAKTTFLPNDGEGLLGLEEELEDLLKKVVVHRELSDPTPLSPEKIYKNSEKPNSKATAPLIPPNALNILAEICYLVDVLEAARTACPYDPMSLDEEALSAVKRAEDELIGELKVLGFRWCKKNPMTHEQELTQENSKSYLSFTCKHKSSWPLQSSVEIPDELYGVLDTYCNGYGPEESDNMVAGIRGDINNLQRKISIAQECKTSEGVTIRPNASELVDRVLETTQSPLARCDKHVMDLVTETLDRARRLKATCSDLLSNDTVAGLTSEASETCCEEIKLFWEYNELFAYRWVGVDPTILKVTCVEKGLRYYYEFFNVDHMPGLFGTERYVEIPSSLYYLHMEMPEIRDVESGDIRGLLGKGREICSHVIRCLGSLQQKLETRELCIGNPAGASNDDRLDNGQPPSTAIGNVSSPSFRASPDYRSVYLGDQEFVLNEKEARVIRLLDKARLSNFPNVVKNTIIDEGCGKASTVTAIRDIFTHKETCRSLVKHVGQGLYRLNVTPDSSG